VPGRVDSEALAGDQLEPTSTAGLIGECEYRCAVSGDREGFRDLEVLVLVGRSYATHGNRLQAIGTVIGELKG